MTQDEYSQIRSSRVALALGNESITKMSAFKVGVIGLTPTGSEIIKNLILTGVGVIEVNDSKYISIYDLGSNFFVRPEDMISSESHPNKRIDKILPRLSHLNRKCKLSGISDVNPLDEKWITQFQSIILAEIRPFSEIAKISEICHRNRIQFIFAATIGPNAALFEDFTDKFVCVNPGGQPPREARVDRVTKSEQPMLALSQSDHDIVFGPNNKILFKDIGGMPQLNGQVATIVKMVSPGNYRINLNTKSMKPFDGKAPKGKIIQIITPHEFSHKPIEETLENSVSNFNAYDSLLLPVRNLFVAISRFMDENKRSPSLLDKSEVDQIFKYLPKNESVNIHPLISKAAMLYPTEYPPTVGMIGGCAAQECIKYITGIFLPTKEQWFVINRCDLIMWNDDQVPKLDGSRYDSITATVGNAVQEKMRDLSALIVGVGAIGCEYARYAALFGFKRLSLIDNDTVELSNLTRQFLFRDKHQGMPKATVGREAILKVNQDIKPENVTAFSQKFNGETVLTVGKNFDIVFSAVDSAEARNFISDYTAVRRIPMINAGMEKHKGNFSIYIPEETTKAYFIEPVVENILPCTLKNLPRTPNHLIQWAHNEFIKFFQNKPEAAQICIKEDGKVDTKSLKAGVTFMNNAPKDFKDCVQWAINKFTRVLEHRSALHLLHNPNDKDLMKTVELDIKNNENHRHYVLVAAQLKAIVHKIEVSETDLSRIDEIIENECKKPDSPIGKEIDLEKGIVDRSKLLETFEKLKKEGFPRVDVINFDKDRKLDILYIESYSKSRSEVFNIDMANMNLLDIMKVVGSIAPTLATTTAVTGAGPFSGLPMLFSEKVDLSFTKGGNIRRYDGNLLFLGLDLKFGGQFKPPRNKKLGSTDEKFNVWDFIDIKDNPTVGELKKRIDSQYGVDVSWTIGEMIIDDIKFADKPIVDIVRELLKYDDDFYLIVQHAYKPNSEEELLMPPIRLFSHI
ncbi:hypothetical protein TRFO_13733 [Tritrichomonas foetus]|uniref:ThiF family protein n=1 Tax=Tritrichomonas foetus TaxID=1144522 RepID=A0A1J4L1Q9_9EUKA|nr:hypothetical protein TRFO_13733 [Tritrichomonas foetus]|eukprot:OHT15886.1 hypothetical protein TRFO_13733 [Tritrichomonas foetus]